MDLKDAVMTELAHQPQVLIKAEIVMPMAELNEIDSSIEDIQGYGSFDVVSVKTITPRHPKYLKQGG